MKKALISIVAVIIGVAIIVLIVHSAKKSASEAATSPLGIFATCVKDSGTKFYGATWCPHCLNQKALFEKAYKQLPYIECSPQQGTLLQVCKDANIESFPTWDYPNGTRVTGGQSIADLAKGSNCPIPVELENIKDKRPQ